MFFALVMKANCCLCDWLAEMLSLHCRYLTSLMSVNSFYDSVILSVLANTLEPCFLEGKYCISCLELEFIFGKMLAFTVALV